MAPNKGQLKFFKPTSLKWGQYSEIWPKNGQSGNPDTNTRFAKFNKYEGRACSH